jgi:predicted ATPase
MPADKKAPDAMHFRSLCLENVRAFGSPQSLKFVDANDATSRWNLILGENGVGKTTLMWALAVMRPVPTNLLPNDESPPKLSKAELSAHENDEIMRFIRRGGTRTTTMTALLDADGVPPLEFRVEIKGSISELEGAEFPVVSHALRSDGPLVIGYGAGRHIGHTNQALVAARNATKSLFSDAIDLYDAEEIIEDLDYRAKSVVSGEVGRDKRRLDMLKTAVARLLPDLTAAQVEINGPRVEGRDQSGVLVQTPSGKTPLADLSLGYQTMFAWTVDLASRLFNAFPESDEPLSESAIVLIDEVDLHLHPQWQRKLRQHLLTQFPKVQFIATTHSPITAQETLSEGGNIAVVRWVDGEAHILNNPIPRGEWRFDQLLVSDLFGLGSDRSHDAEAKLDERLKLIQNPNRSPEQDARLRELNEFVASLPTARSPIAQRFEDLMSEFVKDFPESMAR